MPRLNRTFDALKVYEQGESRITACRRGRMSMAAFKKALYKEMACRNHREVIKTKDEIIENLITIFYAVGASKDIVERLLEVHRNDLTKAMRTYTEWLYNQLLVNDATNAQ